MKDIKQLLLMWESHTQQGLHRINEDSNILTLFKVIPLATENIHQDFSNNAEYYSKNSTYSNNCGISSSINTMMSLDSHFILENKVTNESSFKSKPKSHKTNFGFTDALDNFKFLLETDLSSNDVSSGSFFFTVCDGHDGNDASKFIRNNISQTFKTVWNNNMLNIFRHSKLVNLETINYMTLLAFKQTFQRLESDLCIVLSNSNTFSDDKKVCMNSAGSCIVSIFVIGKYLYCANLGDCRALKLSVSSLIKEKNIQTNLETKTCLRHMSKSIPNLENLNTNIGYQRCDSKIYTEEQPTLILDDSVKVSSDSIKHLDLNDTINRAKNTTIYSDFNSAENLNSLDVHITHTVNAIQENSYENASLNGHFTKNHKLSLMTKSLNPWKYTSTCSSLSGRVSHLSNLSDITTSSYNSQMLNDISDDLDKIEMQTFAQTHYPDQYTDPPFDTYSLSSLINKYTMNIPNTKRIQTTENPLCPRGEYLFNLKWLSRPHKVSELSESVRILDLGGEVKFGRIAGMEPSRTLGDFDLKSKLPLGVISIVPEVSIYEVEEPCIIFMASDGIWDYISIDSILKFLFKKKKKRGYLMSLLRHNMIETTLKKNKKRNNKILRNDTFSSLSSNMLQLIDFKDSILSNLKILCTEITRKGVKISGDDCTCFSIFITP